MHDAETNDIETRLSTLRVAILERPAPGLDEARRRSRRSRRRPVQLAVFVAGVAVLVAALVVYGVNPPARSTSHPNTESPLAQKIDKFAEQGAARAGDPNITEVRWVATNREAAAALLGDDIEVTKPEYLRTVPVYLIEVPGSFSPNVSVPSQCSGGVHGTVADYVVSQSTFQVFEGGVGYQFADLSKLGTVHVDRLRSGPVFPPTTATTNPPGTQNPMCALTRQRDAFVALAQKGADGTFSATYDIPAQPNNVATVVTVAHLAPAGSTSPTSGSWMFELDRSASGDAYLWVSRPHSTAFCIRTSTPRWSCAQTSLTFPQGNAWSLAAAYYLPLTELYGIQQSDADSTTSRQVVDGMPVDCLTDKAESNGATLKWCVTSSGVLASFSAVPQRDGPEFGGSPADGTVTSVSASAPASLFTLPASPGPYTGIEGPPNN